MTLLDLSGKIESSLADLIAVVAGAAEAMRIPFFVVGATARDVVLSRAYDIPIKRATRDVDLGLEIAVWEQFQALKDALFETGRFTAKREPQRIEFEGGIPLDIVPFGAVASGASEISWPPDYSVRMSVVGFHDACQAAHVVRLRSEPALDVRFASPAGLVLLKVIAWKDRGSASRKDAMDLAFILEKYTDAGNQERLLTEHLDLVEATDFDYEYSGARLAGRDVGALASRATKEVTLGILEAETAGPAPYRLVEGMSEHFGRDDAAFERARRFVDELNPSVAKNTFRSDRIPGSDTVFGGKVTKRRMSPLVNS